MFHGGFYGIDINLQWWSSTEFQGTNAWRQYLFYGSSGVSLSSDPKECGFSVRCLKDTGSIQTSLKEEKTFIDINIYPNPFATSTTIELSSNPQTLTIYDILGNIVREEKVSGKTIIERGKLTKGVYVIEVRSENQKYSAKLVVE